MKFHELLETTDEDRALVSLSSALYPKIIASAKDNPRGLNMGRIGDVVNTPLIALNDVEIRILPRGAFHKSLGEPYQDGKSVRGFWDPEKNTVVLNMSLIDSPHLRKTITHELRHALDDYKSNHAASSSDRYNRAREVDMPGLRGDPEYASSPKEVNARYMAGMHMALLKIARLKREGQGIEDIGKQLPDVIKNSFEVNNVAAVYHEGVRSKNYRRLLSRAAQLLQTELSHLFHR